jgi:hypothetical protein
MATGMSPRKLLRSCSAIALGRGEVLLVTAGGPEARVIRIDPERGSEAAVEQDVMALLSSAWHAPVGGVLLAYDHMTRVSDPRTGEPVLLLGLQARLRGRQSATVPTWALRAPLATVLGPPATATRPPPSR